jgi:hypothetical protein
MCRPCAASLHRGVVLDGREGNLSGTSTARFSGDLRANTAFRNGFPVALADGSIPGARISYGAWAQISLCAVVRFPGCTSAKAPARAARYRLLHGGGIVGRSIRA